MFGGGALFLTSSKVSENVTSLDQFFETKHTCSIWRMRTGRDQTRTDQTRPDRTGLGPTTDGRLSLYHSLRMGPVAVSVQRGQCKASRMASGTETRY